MLLPVPILFHPNSPLAFQIGTTHHLHHWTSIIWPMVSGHKPQMGQRDPELSAFKRDFLWWVVNYYKPSIGTSSPSLKFTSSTYICIRSFLAFTFILQLLSFFQMVSTFYRKIHIRSANQCQLIFFAMRTYSQIAYYCREMLHFSKKKKKL